MKEFFDTAEISDKILNNTLDIMNGRAKARFELVNAGDIYLDPEKNPKRYKTKDLAALAMNILQNGMHKPIIVVNINEKQKIYQIISGEKRFRACLLARIDKIPCAVIYPLQKEDDVSPVFENYFEKAKFYTKMIEKAGEYENNIEKGEKISKEELESLVLLLVFTEDEQKMLIDRCVPERTAKKLSRMDTNTRKGFLETIKYGTNITAVCAQINEIIDDEDIEGEKFKKMKFRIRGNCFFFNSINHAIETMREGGIDIEYNAKETESGTILTLVIPK
jgi:ParB family chromosome partitioning protein